MTLLAHARTRSTEETIELGRALGERLVGGEVLALVGDLGSGKTHLVKGIARGLGIADATRRVLSPTFVLLSIHQGRVPLFHFDAYRLSNALDFEWIEGGEYLGSAGVSAIEWADRIERTLPPGHLRIEISQEGQEERAFRFLGGPEWERTVDGIPGLVPLTACAPRT